MKKLSRLLKVLMILSLPIMLGAQEEATLLYNWQDTTLTSTSWLNSRYNEVWGVSINNLEVAIIGSTEGVHFIDVTDPSTAGEIKSAYIPGDAQGSNLVHRDYHDYQGYLYTVADEGASTLQIIDMNQLPDTATLVYADNEFITRSHNIFIDEAAGRLYSTGGEGVAILSLEDPTSPTLLKRFTSSSGFSIPYAHDIHVRGDTAYLNCGGNGLWVVDFSDVDFPKLLGNMTVYEQQGYNHAGWMDESRPFYFLADETHGFDIKTVTVSDFQDMQVLNTFNAGSAPSEIPHNVIVRGNYLYTSYYYDGLQVFDISDIENPTRAFYYDTYDGADGSGFKGAWGIYPLLPSGNILVSDMQTGLYLFEKIDATIVGNDFPEILSKKISVWPQPAAQDFQVQITLKKQLNDVNLRLLDLNGREVMNWNETHLSEGENVISLALGKNVSAGMYFLNINGAGLLVTKKLIVTKSE